MAAVVALETWKAAGEAALEPQGWVRASMPERRICDECGTLRLDRDMCSVCYPY